MGPFSTTLDNTLRRFFAGEARPVAGDRTLIAFSGGPDSTALLAGLAALGPSFGMEVVAAHLDHALDPGSALRACHAAGLASSLGVRLVVARREVSQLRQPGESVEAAARRIRYQFLGEVRETLGARWIATAHHRDDQAETVLLRLLYGSGLDGLASIRPMHGHLIRPLLELGRDELAQTLQERGLEAVADPTNDDLRSPRNAIRHRLLPRLGQEVDGLPLRLANLARVAGRARDRLDSALHTVLDVREVGGGWSVPVAAFAKVPQALLPAALAMLQRRAGAPFPASAAARTELGRQLALAIRNNRRIGCDCGGGWRLERQGRWLTLCPPRASFAGFSYTFEVPGEQPIPELAASFRLRPFDPEAGPGEHGREGAAGWRVVLALPLVPGNRVMVRSRQPGDRIRPMGSGSPRRLKDVFIDRKIPRHERERVPLLLVDGAIAWVPGIAIGHALHTTRPSTSWLAEIVVP